MAQPSDKPPCQRCGRPLVWAADVQQWFCNGCQKYFEPAMSYKGSLDKLFDKVDTELEGQTYRCESCGNKLNWVPHYGRWFCYYCQKYQ